MLFRIRDYEINVGEDYTGDKTDIAVVVPVYNEQQTIETVVRKLTTELGLERVVIVDDGSTDRTPIILDRISKELPELQVLTHKKNIGKGGAIKSALSYLSTKKFDNTKFVFIIDADMQFDPSYILPISNVLLDNDVVVATRSKDDMPLKRKVANLYVDFLYRAVGLNVDIQSGFVGSTTEIAYYRAKNMSNLTRYSVEQEFFLILANYAYLNKKTVNIAKVTVPCSYEGTNSKIKLKDIIKLALIAPINSYRIGALQIKSAIKKWRSTSQERTLSS